MTKFINSNNFGPKNGVINYEKIDLLISLFNLKLEKKSNKDKEIFHLNTTLDAAPYMNDATLEGAKKSALSAGWVLTYTEDNYQSMTYTLKKI